MLSMLLPYTVELTAPLRTTVPQTLIMGGDQKAHTFEVTVLDDGIAADLTGLTVAAYLLRSDGTDVRNPGTIVGNVCTITLDGTCYSWPGAYGLRIILSDAANGIDRTIFRMAGNIENGSGSVVIDPSGTLPTYEQIAEIMEAADDANDAAAAANAAAEAALEAAAQTVGALEADNLVLNGNFTSTLNWIVSNCTIAVADNTATLTGAGSTYLGVIQANKFTSATDKYYVRGLAMAVDSDCTLLRIGNNFTNGGYANVVPVAGRWYPLSIVCSGPPNADIYLRAYYPVTAVGKVAKFQYVFSMNLTEKFGAGYEPTAAQMDLFMAPWPNSFFSGTANVAQADKVYYSAQRLKRQIDERGVSGIISGLGVTAQSTPNMTVAVAAGVCYNSLGKRFTPVAVSEQAITGANATYPRYDIIYVDTYGVVAYLAGTAAALPVAPTLPAGGTLCATIAVGASVTSITTGNIALALAGTAQQRQDALAKRVLALETSFSGLLTTENQNWSV